MEQWRRYLHRSVNLFFQCAATHLVLIGKRGDRFYNWYVELKPGNDPKWVEQLLENVLIRARREREKTGYGIPNSITVFTPGADKLTIEAEGD